MEKFSVHVGTAVPLRRSNVDTDQIIPAVYLKRVTRTGFEDGLFSAWRANEAEFVLNQTRFDGATILVAGPDFGTGSSREHAVWALVDYGFKVVISPRFADIFRGNSLKAGLLTVELAEKIVQRLWDDVEDNPDTEVTVDLLERQVRWSGEVHDFELDDYSRWRLLEGLDDISSLSVTPTTSIPTNGLASLDAVCRRVIRFVFVVRHPPLCVVVGSATA